MVPFLVTGAVVGIIVGLLLATFGPDAPNASPSQELIVMAVPGGLLGGLLGAICYLLVERYSER